MTITKRLLILLIFASPTFAQGVRHVNIALGTGTVSGSGGAVSKPLPSASITVCTGSTLPAPGAVCSGLASIFVDVGLTGLIGNPTNADLQGNYSFYAVGGIPYVVSVSSVGFTTYSYVWSAPISLNGSYTWTAPQNFSGGISSSGPITASAFISSSPTPALTGTLRLASNVDAIEWRNNANTNDIGLSKNTSDFLNYGGAGFIAASLTATGLSAGNCVQASTGGLLTTIVGACGTSSGTLTATGSPVAGQGAFWSGAASVTGSANWTYAAASGHSVTQGANGVDAFYMKRFTDAASTGNFLHFQNNAAATDLFKVDVLGNSLGSSFGSTSVNPALSGIHRCASGDACLVFRNNANSGDVALSKNTSDQPTFSGNIVPTFSGAVTGGDVVTIANSGQIQDGGALPHTNGGTNGTVCTTGAGAGSTCSTIVNLFRTEPNTSYAVSATCVGPSQFPFILGVTKSTTSVTVTLVNGVSNEAQASTCSELDVVATR